jgi:hypothetical protein
MTATITTAWIAMLQTLARCTHEILPQHTDASGAGTAARVLVDGPWPTWPKPNMPDFTHMSRKVKEVIRAACLRDELSFISFRHGGFT